MPSGKTHLKLGLYVGIVFTILDFLINGLNIQMLFYPVVIYVYSLLPDLDSHTAKLRSYMYQFLFGILVLSPLFYLTLNTLAQRLIAMFVLSFVGLVGLFIYKLRHRGLLHQHWVGVILSIPLFFMHYKFMFLAILMFSTHIIADKFVSKWKRLFKSKKEVIHIKGCGDVIIDN